MAKAVKLADIAERLGVSSVTVSKALADKSGVSDELRIKIKNLAKEMGYKTASSKSSTRQDTGNIGILISAGFLTKISSFYWELYQNIVNELAKKGYYGILEVLSKEETDNLVLPNMVKDHKIDGLIVMGQTSSAYTEYLWNLEFLPVVYLDFYDTNIHYDAVISDGFYGMYVLTDYLIKMGHRDIGFVGTPLATSSIMDRYLGYYKALLQNGIAPNSEWVIPDRIEKDQIRGDFTLPEHMPTAFACNCDNTAYVVIKEVEKRGLSVPDDISVVGFDNYAYSEFSDPYITTYDVNIKKMASLSLRTLLRKIKGKEYPKGIQMVNGKIIIKDTVKKINN